MDDIVGRIFALLITVLLMFIFPLMDTWERQDDLSYIATYSAVVRFVDSIRNTGFVTPDMIAQFEMSLGATGNSYDIEYERRRIVYVPGTNGTSSYVPVYLIEYTPDFFDDIELIDSTVGGDGKYYFNKGDYFFVSVKNTNKTQNTVIKDFIFGTSMPNTKIAVPYGGMIKNDPYRDQATVQSVI